VGGGVWVRNSDRDGGGRITVRFNVRHICEEIMVERSRGRRMVGRRRGIGKKVGGRMEG
jgi:hypothetical protein